MSRFGRVGAILMIAGILATLLGFVGAVNRLETCYVVPTFGGCFVYYQVALFAPFYPVSGVLIILGGIIAVAGVTLTVIANTTRQARYSAAKDVK